MRVGDMSGPTCLLPGTIRDWLEFTSNDLVPEEKEMILRMDQAYVQTIRRVSELYRTKSPPPQQQE